MNLMCHYVSYLDLLASSNAMLSKLAEQIHSGPPQESALTKIGEIAAFQRFLWDHRHELGLMSESAPTTAT